MNTALHIGDLLEKVFQKKKVSKAALSRAMNCYPSSIQNDLKSNSLQVAKLLQYCAHVQHNFFMDVAMQLPESYTTEKDIFEEKNKYIAQLEEELKTVKIERDILLKAFGKG